MDSSGIGMISAAISLAVAGWKSLDVWLLNAKIKKMKTPKRKTKSKKKKQILKGSPHHTSPPWMVPGQLPTQEDIDRLLGIAVASSNKLSVEILIRANAGLYKAMLTKLISTNKNNKGFKEANDFNLTIAEMLFTTKAKQSLVAYAFVAVAAFTHIVLAALTSQDINGKLLLFLAIVFALIHLNQKILEFRIGKGFYGKNEYEAREMVSFLLNHSDKTDFSDGDGQKKLFPKVKDSEQRLEEFGGLVGVTK